MQFWTLFGFSVSTGGQIKTVLNSPWTVVWIGEIVYAMRTFPDTIHSFLSVGPDKSFWFWLVKCVRREIVH